MQDTELFECLIEKARRDGVKTLVVGAVVCDNGMYLFLRRPPDEFMGGIFEFPSGKIEPGEGIAEAIVREVNEETGIEVTAIGRYLGSFDYDAKDGSKSRQYNFLVDTGPIGELALTEHDDYLWCCTEQFDCLNLSEETRRIAEQVAV